jgi:hypothetical protein
MTLVLPDKPLTVPIDSTDSELLIASFNPPQRRRRAAVVLAMSTEGLRHNVLGRSAAALRDVETALTAAELSGFVVERVARRGESDGTDVFIRERWLPGCWVGKGRLLEHFAFTADDGFYDHLVAWLRYPPNRGVCSLLLRAIALQRDLLELLPPAPDLEPEATLYERTISWFVEAADCIGVRAEEQPRQTSTSRHRLLAAPKDGANQAANAYTLSDCRSARPEVARFFGTGRICAASAPVGSQF